MSEQLVSGNVVAPSLPVEQRSEDSVTVFKRYQNRKLYNPSVSSYVTLKDIFKLVQENKKVQVINNKTNEDITTSVLLNALVEGSKGQDATEVASMLKHLASYIKEGENNG